MRAMFSKTEQRGNSMGFQFRDYQDETLAKVRAYVATAPKVAGYVIAPTGCHAAGHPILMHDGSLVAAECVTVGGAVMGPDGTARRVTSLHRGREPMYRITPKTGGPSFVVNGGHILSLTRTSERAKSSARASECRGGERVFVSVDEYIGKTKNFKHLHKLERTGVQAFAASRDFFEVDPWVLGAFIGNGGMTTASLDYTTMDEEQSCRIEAFAGSHGISPKRTVKAGGHNRAWKLTFGRDKWVRGDGHPMWSALVRCGLARCGAGDKYIPHEYKTASRDARLQLLAGLIDTDGHYDGRGFEFSSKSKRLADDFVFVARSLGFASPDPSEKIVKGVSYWRVNIYGDLDQVPTCVPRKQAAPRRQKKNHLVSGFDIECVGVGDYFGFSLDGDRLYLDGSFTIHHNSGKGPMQAQIALDAFDAGERVLSTVHTRELVAQNAAAFQKIRPGVMVGVYSAGLNSREARAPITVAGIQSVFRKPQMFGKIGTLIIDEAHLARSSEGMYSRLIAGFRERNPDLKIIGLSATVFFDLPELADCIHAIQVRMLVERGFLSRIVTKRTATKMDVTGVKITAGDFNEKALAAAVDHDAITKGVVDDALRIGGDRKSCLAFGVGVEHARHIAEEFRRRGRTFGFVCGETPTEERDAEIAKFKSGEYWGIANAGVLTTGFDHPPVDLIVLARPTRSPVLFSQICGRGMRIHPGKTDCLLADYGGVVQALGPVDLLDVDIKEIQENMKAKKKSPRAKTCSACDCVIPIKEATCPECGHVEIKIPPTQSGALGKLSMKSGGGAVVTDGTLSSLVRDGETLASVLGLASVRVHENTRDPSKPPTLRLMLNTNMGILSAFLCPEHSGYARKASEKTWSQMGISTPMPFTARAAYNAISKLDECDWRLPTHLRTKRDGQWQNVVAPIFADQWQVDDTHGAVGGRASADLEAAF